MNYSKFLKVLSSYPVILIGLYFVPFLGVCLILLRHILYSNKKYSTPIFLITSATIILIPKLISWILDLIKIENEVPYFNDIVKSDTYLKLIDYSKFLLCLGVVLLIISIVLKNIMEKIKNTARNYINQKEIAEREISEKNDMKIKIKQEQAKNTRVVICSRCGADNMISEKTGTCKFCRSKIQ